ncbi:hypothetical protein Godav_003264, partial [Gossypium davidsonii]|nr:hypothetical protein [Gossypium davidsonii]
MSDVLGFLKVIVQRGINLAIRDAITSDPYVVIHIGQQAVYDKDTFTLDDQMGMAEIDLKPYIAALKMAKGLHNLPNSCALKRIQPNQNNCLANESSIIWENGKITQDMRIKLKNVECGELLIQLDWNETPNCKGLESE